MTDIPSRIEQDAPTQPELNQLIGLYQSRRYPELDKQAGILLQRYPTAGQIWLGLGLSLRMQGKNAVSALQHAARYLPDQAEVHSHLGDALRDMGQLEGAVASYRQVLQIRPDIADVHGNLGTALHYLGRPEEAIASYRQVLQLMPRSAEAHNNLGAALQDLGQLAEAVTSYRMALQIKPKYAEARNNLGAAFRDMGQFEDAIGHYRLALEAAPGYSDAAWNLSLALLTLGRYAEAWPLYESRYDPRSKETSIQIPVLPFPQWRGEPLHGKSLLIWPEQGFGDNIQFARYAPVLKNLGLSRLTLVCAPPLKELLETIDGVDVVMDVTTADIATIGRHDYWSFPLSLPLHCKTTLDTIPATLPYVQAIPARVEQWRNRLPTLSTLSTAGCKVGLVWQGNKEHKNDARRSLPGISTLAALWNIPGITFISLQTGQEEGPAMMSLGSGIVDFADTAAIVAGLDLVICVDTAIAHLVGAMGKPCWVLLPAFGTDWRWLLKRADTPWYPGSMRLFRQAEPGNWHDVILAVAAALRLHAGPPPTDG